MDLFELPVLGPKIALYSIGHIIHLLSSLSPGTVLTEHSIKLDCEEITSVGM